MFRQKDILLTWWLRMAKTPVSGAPIRASLFSQSDSSPSHERLYPTEVTQTGQHPLPTDNKDLQAWAGEEKMATEEKAATEEYPAAPGGQALAAAQEKAKMGKVVTGAVWWRRELS